MITHIKFVSIPTRDQDRALAFWTERVGCRLLTDQPFDDKQRWIEMRIGTSDTRLVLFSGDGANAMQPGGILQRRSGVRQRRAHLSGALRARRRVRPAADAGSRGARLPYSRTWMAISSSCPAGSVRL